MPKTRRPDSRVCKTADLAGCLLIHRFTWAAKSFARCRPLRCGGLALLASLSLSPSSWSQPIISAPRPTSTNQPDPLAALMISQPPIDTVSPIKVTTEFEPNIITLGQSAVYRVVLNVMEQSIEWPDSVPSPGNSILRRGAAGQFLQNLGGVIVPQTTFLYHLKPTATGTFTQPAYTIRARGEDVRIPATTLTVLPADAANIEPAPTIQLTADGTDFYVGQNVDLQIAFPGKADGTVQTLAQVDVVGDGLIVDRNFRAQRIETQINNGVARPTFIYQALATPMRPGRTEVIAQGFKVGNQFQGQIIIRGPATLPRTLPSYTLVDSEPLALTILPLPRESQLPGFTGGIGSFTVDPPTLSTNHVRAGDLITLNLTVRGQGNLERLLPPIIEPDPRWQIVPPRKENILAAIVRQRGYVTFDYKLIPLDEGIKSTPPVPFSCFDPKMRTYVDLTVAPAPIKVDPSPISTAATAQTSLIEARSFLRELLTKPEEPTELAPMLTSIGRSANSLEPTHQKVWFALVQIVPAALLGGLWFWDRRRRYLEEHAEVVIRRRARKAIRRHARQARRAVGRSDIRQFLHHAIQGFCEACAPAAPANPQALVCVDILNALPTELRNDQIVQVVNRLFSAANAWRFGAVQPVDNELLALANQVDQQLEILRENL